MKVTVFGANGQLGQSLAATSRPDISGEYLTREDCNLLDPAAINTVLTRSRPDLIINAAAYTAVDRAEEEPELAKAINATAVGVMAEWAAREHARLIHLSTDFVFDGSGQRAYRTDDEVAPLGSYGTSKLAGEVLAGTAGPQVSMIIRTAWVYSEYGNNFVRTMLRLMQERDSLSVVNDQRGSPTYAGGLAQVIWTIITGNCFQPGIFHWTDNGNISWYEFACEIQTQAAQLGLLDKPIPINGITTDQYPTPATRPAYSVLDSSRLASLLERSTDDWQANLNLALTRLANRSAE